MFNTPRFRTQRKCICYNKDPQNLITTLNVPGYNRANALFRIGTSVENTAIKGKTTFVTRQIDEQFGNYKGKGGTVLSNF